MRVTERDIDILRWINSVGFANIEHIVSRYKISKPTAYARLKKLTDEELFAHEYHLHSHPGHYRVTRDGTKLSEDHLSPLSNVKLTTYKHDQWVTTLSIILEKRHNGQFITERQLRYQQGFEVTSYRRAEHHYSDGILMIGNKKIAIEVELTTKGQARLKKIYSHYLFSSDLDEIWYFCGNNEVQNLIQKVMGVGGNIKTFLLDEVVSKSRNPVGT